MGTEVSLRARGSCCWAAMAACFTSLLWRHRGSNTGRQRQTAPPHLGHSRNDHQHHPLVSSLFWFGIFFYFLLRYRLSGIGGSGVHWPYLLQCPNISEPTRAPPPRPSPFYCLFAWLTFATKSRLRSISGVRRAGGCSGRTPPQAGGLRRRNAPSFTVTEEGQMMGEWAPALPDLWLPPRKRWSSDIQRRNASQVLSRVRLCVTPLRFLHAPPSAAV